MMRADMATVVTARGGVRGGRNEQSGRIFAPLLIPFLILAAIAVYAALAPYAKTNVPPPGAHGSLVWGGAIFANELEMKAWLRLHGAVRSKGGRRRTRQPCGSSSPHDTTTTQRS